MMEKQKLRPLTRLYQNPWGRILLSGVATGIFLCAFSMVQTISYLTNDDNAIAWALAGYQTGTTIAYAQFINCLLGYLVSALYTVAAGVPWWSVLQLISMAVSLLTIGACFLSMGARRKAPLLLPLGLHGALMLLCLQPVVELTYTVTGAIVGAAGAVLAVCALDASGKGRRVWLSVLSAAFMLLAFLYREETGFAVLCFQFVACGYGVLSALAKKRRVWLGVLLFLSSLIICLAAFAFNNSMQKAYHGTEYRTFFQYRERFTDYPRDSYEQNPELYQSVGWDETVFDLADRWCFMDERINAQALKTITEGSKVARPTLVQAIKACVAVIDGEVDLRLMAAFLLCMGAFALYLLWRRRCWPAGAVALLCVVLGSGALCLALGFMGRFLGRTFQVIAIPACALACVFVLELYQPEARREERWAFGGIAGIALALALAAGLVQAKTLRVNSPKYLLSESRAVVDFVLEHPESVYVRDTYVINNVDAMTTYPGQKPVNLISWGGCEMHSRTANLQLKVNGLPSGYADIFFLPGVYFVTAPDSSEHAAMERYLHQTYGARLVWVEAITVNAAVYQAVLQGE